MEQFETRLSQKLDGEFFKQNTRIKELDSYQVYNENMCRSFEELKKALTAMNESTNEKIRLQNYNNTIMFNRIENSIAKGSTEHD